MRKFIVKHFALDYICRVFKLTSNWYLHLLFGVGSFLFLGQFSNELQVLLTFCVILNVFIAGIMEYLQARIFNVEVDYQDIAFQGIGGSIIGVPLVLIGFDWIIAIMLCSGSGGYWIYKNWIR